jgi:Conjugal transfer protein TraD
MTHRVEASQRRTDTREWVMQRRERTRHLIELGGLVQKAGLIELADDDRAVLLGAFFAVAAKLEGEERGQAITLWRRRGKRAFEDDRQ